MRMRLMTIVLIAVVAAVAGTASAGWIDPPDGTYITSSHAWVAGSVGKWDPGRLIAGTYDAEGNIVPITSPSDSFDTSGGDSGFVEWQTAHDSEPADPTTLTYNFDQQVTLDGLYLWNAQFRAVRGIKDFTVSFSTDGSTFSDETSTFTASSGANPSQLFEFNPVTAQYAKITILQDQGGGSTEAAELHFIPEPATFGLLGLFGIVVLLRRKLIKK